VKPERQLRTGFVAPMELIDGESVNRDCDEVMCVEPGGE